MGGVCSVPMFSTGNGEAMGSIPMFSTSVKKLGVASH